MCESRGFEDARGGAVHHENQEFFGAREDEQLGDNASLGGLLRLTRRTDRLLRTSFVTMAFKKRTRPAPRELNTPTLGKSIKPTECGWAACSKTRFECRRPPGVVDHAHTSARVTVSKNW
jgi:hypothetical protein